jgi:TolA-binding protein
MRGVRGVLLLGLGMAACATPGQVRRVETAVATADRDRARSDSAQRSELARIQISQRQDLDSMSAMMRQLSDNLQRMSRDDASNFDDLRQRLYQVVALAGTVQSKVQGLRNQLDVAVSTAPAATPTDTSAHAPGTVQVPPPDVLIQQANTAITASAYGVARRTLNQLLTSYPQSPQVADAYYYIAYSFETEQPDSARAYYTRVFTDYPKADKASAALFKLGSLEKNAGNVPTARKYWQMIVDKYKDSIEYAAAQDRLRENP